MISLTFTRGKGGVSKKIPSFIYETTPQRVLHNGSSVQTATAVISAKAGIQKIPRRSKKTGFPLKTGGNDKKDPRE